MAKDDTAHLTWLALRREVVQLRVHPQPCNQADVLEPTYLVEQHKDDKATVSDEDQHSIRQPAGDQSNHLPGAFGQLSMLTCLLRVVAFRGAQHGKSPDRIRPRHRVQQ
ncbi:MAG: hypothetical protein M3X11_24655, partial [Acidobacteriota bacterium]|nr:hypothetical protein [Acidobacteriota bacterium]